INGKASCESMGLFCMPVSNGERLRAEKTRCRQTGSSRNGHGPGPAGRTSVTGYQQKEPAFVLNPGIRLFTRDQTPRAFLPARFSSFP
ncbi:hypothetical protein ACUTEI_002769, partial [Cronobacter sakazakii]